MTDYEWDALFDQLKRLEEETGEILPDSPTNRVSEDSIVGKKEESIMPKDAKVILFGSRARRDAKADSDWDILVLLNKDKIDEQDHDNYTYPLWELGWQINQMIHPIVYSMKDWQSKKGSPFYNNVEEEGVMLC